MAPGEFKDWAAGTGRTLAEFTTQLTRSAITRSPRQRDRATDVGAGIPEDHLRPWAW